MFQADDEEPFYMMPTKLSVAGEANASFGQSKSSCNNCTQLKFLYESKITELENNLSKRFDVKFEELKGIIQSQNAAIKQMMGQKSPIKIDSTENIELDSSIPSFFPICTEESLHQINNHICQKNKDIYCTTIQKLLRDNLNKNLDKVLSTEIMLKYNLDGTQGKKSLKTYDRLLKVLFAVIEHICDSNEDPDTLLRHAITKLKNRHYKRVSRMSKAEKSISKLESIDDDIGYTNDPICNDNRRFRKRKKL